MQIRQGEHLGHLKHPEISKYKRELKGRMPMQIYRFIIGGNVLFL